MQNTHRVQDFQRRYNYVTAKQRNKMLQLSHHPAGDKNDIMILGCTNHRTQVDVYQLSINLSIRFISDNVHSRNYSHVKGKE